MEIIKKNSYGLGFLMGVVLPLILFGILMLINLVVRSINGGNDILDLEQMLLLSIAINLISMRMYFVNMKYEKSGKGILIITFMFIITYFTYYS